MFCPAPGGSLSPRCPRHQHLPIWAKSDRPWPKFTNPGQFLPMWAKVFAKGWSTSAKLWGQHLEIEIKLYRMMINFVKHRPVSPEFGPSPGSWSTLSQVLAYTDLWSFQESKDCGLSRVGSAAMIIVSARTNSRRNLRMQGEPVSQQFQPWAPNFGGASETIGIPAIDIEPQRGRRKELGGMRRRATCSGAPLFGKLRSVKSGPIGLKMPSPDTT